MHAYQRPPIRLASVPRDARGAHPIGVTFVGTAFSESKLLADGFAYEQGTKWPLAPSFTNPSMWLRRSQPS